MNRIKRFLKELENEAVTTRKMLQRVPAEKFDWQPHEKSMSLKRLAAHVAELPGWVAMVLTTDQLDFANNPYTPKEITNNEGLMAYFEESLASARQYLTEAYENLLDENWTLRNGDQIYSADPKEDVIRMSISQTIHHRAQLGVYLRLLNIPIPGSYGPSADDASF